MGRVGRIGVAIIDPIGSHGGMHYYLHGQAESLVDQNMDVAVYALPASTDAGARYRKVNLFQGVFGADPKWLRGLRLLRELTCAIWNAKRNGARVCIFHLFKMDFFELYSIRAARMLGMRTIGVVHDVEQLDRINKNARLETICGLLDIAVLHNEFSKAALLKAVSVPPKRIELIPHGNYVAQFGTPPSQDAARARLGLDSDKVILLFFGNPRREKGLDILLDAMQSHRDCDRLLLLIAGKMKPDERADYEARIARNGISSRVRMDIGHVADEDIAFYYRAADLVCLPYLRIYESGVALMAMSLERPILASDLPPLRDLIGEDSRGLLFRPGDATGMAARLGEVLARPAILKDLSRSAFIFARDERAWGSGGQSLARKMAEIL